MFGSLFQPKIILKFYFIIDRAVLSFQPYAANRLNYVTLEGSTFCMIIVIHLEYQSSKSSEVQSRLEMKIEK